MVDMVAQIEVLKRSFLIDKIVVGKYKVDCILNTQELL
jgi:hypothetical protein